MKLNLQKLSMNTSPYRSYPTADNEGHYYYVTEVESLLKEIGYLTDLNLKNDSHRHDIVFKGVNITYRLSVKKSHFWIYNRDTGMEIQYISRENGDIQLYDKWENFMEEFWDDIQKDMKKYRIMTK